MAIKKNEFYEGAALHMLIRGSNSATNIIYIPPLFVVNEKLQLYLKYSTAKRSPWGFTFMPDEQLLLDAHSRKMMLVIGLVCGDDGVAALPHDDYIKVAPIKNMALHLSCRRSHREYFEIGGPEGTLPSKVAPSDWVRLLVK